MENLVKTSYSLDDVTILLQDLKGKVEILDTAEREKRIQEGVHYSEMLPLEYKPTEEYMKIYNEALESLSYETALAVAVLSEKLYQKHGVNLVIVSLARAGTPVGILVKRYLKFVYDIDVPHYSISIIRGKGIDVEAMQRLCNWYDAAHIQFLDGWVGKGAINKTLHDAVEDFKDLMHSMYSGPLDVDALSSELAVLSDPANVTDLCGTHQDFLIPSACLNATVSGLISRTVKLPTMTDEELHGAIYYSDYEDVDRSNEFIDTVCSYFTLDLVNKAAEYFKENSVELMGKGTDDLKYVSDTYNVKDINLIKPGVGETTRVLLRRVPYIVLVKEGSENLPYLKHIYRLASEKGVAVKSAPLKSYNVIGVIRQLSDV